MCFFFCMKKKQKIKPLDLLTEKEENRRLLEATFLCDKSGEADGTL